MVILGLQWLLSRKDLVVGTSNRWNSKPQQNLDVFAKMGKQGCYGYIKPRKNESEF